tara:strand:- start:240 stop:425 length:186 start_codon:yes stop_codon:yes gene_type:complete
MLAVGVVTLAALAGCDDPKATVQLHEPGKYLGAKDPLLEKTAGGAKDEALKDRFAQIQRDR